MTLKSKSKVERVLLLTAGWVIAGLYINIIQFSSIMMVLDIISVPYDFKNNFIINITEIFIAGLILASFEVFYFTDRFKKKSFGYAVLMKSLFYAGGLVVLIFLISYVESLKSKELSSYLLENFITTVLITFFIWGPIFLISTFIMRVSEKYGQGVLWKFILGKYHQPKEETRIFMFLDLKSSTSIAEALGNVRYFELLTDFFYDVTDAILDSKGEIYQYVGDEIVISWKLKNGIENSNSLSCFFEINKVIKKYSEKYQIKYNLVPSFKAGVHFGEVTVGEIGVLKREITFSGDVLNTTSRIQELCNKYNEKLIVSKSFLDLLNTNNGFVFKEIGQLSLRGRTEPVVLYSVKEE